MGCTPRESANERCPSDLALEEYLLDLKSGPCALHVDACEVCRGRIAAMEQEGRDFLEQVYPSTVGKVQAAARVRRRTGFWVRRGSGHHRALQHRTHERS
jgi:hypothetical protein